MSVYKEKTYFEKMMAPLKVSWSMDGCSILMDGWTNVRNLPLIKIIVSLTFDPYLLTSIDFSSQEKNIIF